jgi:4-diphosphocytidyl-2-C-methyl-D-erythritol kinase
VSLALPARAKLNLDLLVVRRAGDGFHELQTTFQEIELHDLLLIERSPQTGLTIEGMEVATKGNSVLAAHEAIEQATGRKVNAKFHLYKRIPPGSGMGGASSDAAAALKGMKALFDLDLDLVPIARRLGSDVPFFVTGGRAKAVGRGEQLTRQPASGNRWFAIAWPGIELRTADVYRAWDQVKGESPNDLRRAAEYVEPKVKEFAKKLGEGWQMTGSGSAFFKLAATEQEATAAIQDLDCWTAATRAID